ncbi:unnamed protein product [Acanthosepion pharaonis]|uniref:Protein SIX6OS1 n=1 Tax=Acanthosepion pharaonis TaxID=158019 RepID=A0A812B308_ACAPH|nr:unnamed protein product [Sepia pharaonis]
MTLVKLNSFLNLLSFFCSTDLQFLLLFLFSCTEYDNQQYIISIEKEIQLIKDFSRDIEMTKLSIIKLQESVSEMDESTKRVHKQYTMNRDNCISLKKTSTLLTQHFAALTKKLDTFISKYKEEKDENQKILDHYWNIWKDYDAKYQTLSFVQVLENKMKEFSITEAHLKDKKQEKQELITNFVNLQGSKLLNNQELQSIRKQKNISLLESKIKQKNKEKHVDNSSPEEPELNKESIQPDMCLAPEEPQIPEEMDDQCLDKVGNEYVPSKQLPRSEPKTHFSLQPENSSITYEKNVLISKTCEKTSQSFHDANLFKQPDISYAKNQRSTVLNTKVSQPLVSIINTVMPEDIMRSTKTSISDTVDRLPNAASISMVSLHSPLIQNGMLKQTASGNCNQLKDNSDNKITLVPSTSVHNSCADIQVTQSVSLASQQIPAVLTPSHFPSEAPQTSLPISNSNSNSSQMTTSSKQPPLSTAPEIAQISADNNEGTLTTVALGVGQKLFDFDEHQKFLQKFHSSPGAPSLRQRPMFQMTDQKTNDEKVDEKTRVENPFFLQSFFTEQDEISQCKQTPVSAKSSETTFLSPYTDPFPGFNQNSGNETAASPLDLGFSNSLGETTSETNFFSFDANSEFTQTEDSTVSFTFNFNASELIASVNYDKVESIQKVERLPLEKERKRVAGNDP